jgi:hypothetical protein
MDDTLFDTLTVLCRAPRTRRGLGAAAALAALGLTGRQDAEAKKKKKKPSGTCIEPAQECQGGGCCAGLECKPIFTVGDETYCCRSAGTCRFGADCCRGTYCGGGECLPCKGVGEDCLAGQCCAGSFCDTTFTNKCVLSD